MKVTMSKDIIVEILKGSFIPNIYLFVSFFMLYCQILKMLDANEKLIRCSSSLNNS